MHPPEQKKHALRRTFFVSGGFPVTTLSLEDGKATVASPKNLCYNILTYLKNKISHEPAGINSEALKEGDPDEQAYEK
jgi:hypothetical protein